MSYSTEPMPTLNQPEIEVRDNVIPSGTFLMDLNKQHFITMLLETKRLGIENLIDYLSNETDFFKAPASTKFHSNYPGGLVEHSLKVYDLLATKNTLFDLDLSEETCIITGLLHDVCKANFYAAETKSVLKGKIEVERNKKDDSGTWYKTKEMVNNWVEEEVYVVKDQFPVGHSEKSLAIIEKYITLTNDEIMMIRWHMGFTEPKEFYNCLHNAIDLCPAIIALYTADLESSNFSEEKLKNE